MQTTPTAVYPSPLPFRGTTLRRGPARPGRLAAGRPTGARLAPLSPAPPRTSAPSASGPGHGVKHLAAANQKAVCTPSGASAVQDDPGASPARVARGLERTGAPHDRVRPAEVQVEAREPVHPLAPVLQRLDLGRV